MQEEQAQRPMTVPLADIRSAVLALYASHSSEQRHAADTWLRAFVGREGAWRALAELLTSPSGTSPEARYFAATSLRLLCQRQKGPTEADAAPALAQLLAAQLALSASVGDWHTGNPLAASLATLAARTPSWREVELVPQLLLLAQAALQAAGVGAEQQQLALLRLLACLAEAAAASRDVSMHPQRRQALQQALLSAPQPLAAVQHALAGPVQGAGAAGSSSATVQGAALQLLTAWCSLGVPPAGAEGLEELWRQLQLAAILPEVGTGAAEAAAALYGCCGGSSGTPQVSSSDAAEHAQRRQQVLTLLLSQLPSLGAALQQAIGQGAGQGQQQQQHHHHHCGQSQQLFAALTLLGAAARAADSQQQWPGALAGSVNAAAAAAADSSGATAAAAHAVHLAAEVALAALHHPQFDVALAGLQHWDEQIERWMEHQVAEQQAQQQQQHEQQAQEVPPQQAQHQGACAPQQRQALLGRLCGALLLRMALPANLPASCATADARDLPDAVQLVRRECADTFRAAADCLGLQQTRQQLLQLAEELLAAWQAQQGAPAAAAAAAGNAGSGGQGSWQQLECCLYALNLVWTRQRSQQAEEEAAREVRRAVEVATAALQPGTPKLAGTALTLLGGMADQLLLLLPLPASGRAGHWHHHHHHHQQQQQQQQQQDAEALSLVAHLLARLLQLVRHSGDEKLSRNAATCCYRLTGCRQLAARLAAAHPDWAHELCRCFAAAGGMRERAQQGEDLTLQQFLLVSICHLAEAGEAVGVASAGATAGTAANGSNGGTALLLQLLSQPAAAADEALSAAALAASGSEPQRHLLGQAAVQVETIAVALEAVAGGTGISGMAAQLPGMLGELSGVLQRAATAVAAAATVLPGQQPVLAGLQAHQQHGSLLLQAVCRVSAAVAATPAAGLGLELLLPFVSAPPHPSVLLTLAQLASSSGGPSSASSSTHNSSSSSSSMEHLPPAVSSSLRAAAARHAANPDWQPAILALGEACLLHLPAASADAATLDALLTTAQHSMQSYHREACEQVLCFAETLLCLGYPCPRAGGGAGGAAANRAVSASRPPTSATAADAAAVLQLRHKLDSGGLGAALLLGLLLAAAGAMPPYMMVLIADTQHRTWQAVGDARFGAWLRGAALQRAPEGAPWRGWKAEAQQAAVEDLLSPQCAQDARRFKRLLKVFCGGKKKGQHAEQPARAK